MTKLGRDSSFDVRTDRTTVGNSSYGLMSRHDHGLSLDGNWRQDHAVVDIRPRMDVDQGREGAFDHRDES